MYATQLRSAVISDYLKCLGSDTEKLENIEEMESLHENLEDLHKRLEMLQVIDNISFEEEEEI